MKDNVMNSRKKLSVGLPALAVLCLLALSVSAAEAATYTVKNLFDSFALGDGCSLREAIAAHNGNGGGNNECGVFDPADDKIVFLSSLSGTLRLNPALGELVIRQPSVVIQGPGAAKVSISASKVMSVLVLDQLAPPPLFTVRGLTIRDGLGKAAQGGFNDQGGGIRMEVGGAVPAQPSSILLEDVVLFANAAAFTGNSRGAAIQSYGDLVMRRCKVLFNQSDLGAIWHDGTALIENSELSDNAASFVAGAVVFASNGPWTVRGSLFRGNSAASNGFTGIVFLSNTGKGLVENSTFVGNFSDTGGVISTQSPVTVRNSTFYGNFFTGPVSDAVIGASASVLTLSSNLFGKHEMRDVSAWVPGGATVIATRNLFDTAQAALPAGVLCAPTTAGGKNLCGVLVPGVAGLANNGGPTMTMALLSGSPALDAGENLGGLLTDQRGTGFPREIGAAADIGAYEAP